jgi:UDP-glucose 4-epimerase
VKELLEAVRRVGGRDFEIKYGPRRQGDSPALVADNALAKTTIGWSPQHDLKSIIGSAWNWHSSHPPA